MAAGGDGSGGGAAARGGRLGKRGFVDAADVYREEWMWVSRWILGRRIVAVRSRLDELEAFEADDFGLNIVGLHCVGRAGI